MRSVIAAALFFGLMISGCGADKSPAPPSAPAAPVIAEPSPPPKPEPKPEPPKDPRPDLMYQPLRGLTRDQIRDGFLRLLEEPGAGGPAERLQALAKRFESQLLTWGEADLDGDGANEFVLALPVHNPEHLTDGAVLVVIYQKDGRWAVDRSEPQGKVEDLLLMAPTLQAVADLAGMGRPQIIWSRPESIATGPQPGWVFVTAWKPGAFTQLPGNMAISRPAKDGVKISADGKDLLLTGVSRKEWIIRTGESIRTDRYRFVDGAFRLVDRRFTEPSDFGYDRFWDGLVAEEVGRLKDAEQAYRSAADPKTVPHSGSVYRYKQMPREITPAEMARFSEALRTFARFRLGGLLLQQGKRAEAEVALQPEGPYAGLTDAMRKAPDRSSGCQAAAAWAAANPNFFAELHLGVGHSRWTPELLCTHMPLEEKLL